MRSARLFAAVAFTPAEQEALAAASARLRGLCASGRFPDPSLLHITLHFFGQTDLSGLGAIESAMRRAASLSRPFTMETGRAGSFGRGDSCVLWLGVGAGLAELRALQSSLEDTLEAAGFPREGRDFMAHITLGRDVRLAGSVSDAVLPPVKLPAGAITLMESTQAGGKLQYIPLLSAPLGSAK